MKVLLKNSFRLLSLVVCFSMLFSAVSISAEENAPKAMDEDSVGAEYSTLDENSEYLSYLGEYSSVDYCSQDIVVDAADLIATENTVDVVEQDGFKSIEVSDRNKFAEYNFTVKESALFNIQLTYKAIEDTGMDIRLGFEFDGESPYEDLVDISFSRIWENKDAETVYNDNGDEVRPEQKEKFKFNTRWVENSLGIYSVPYAVYLEKGTHTLKINRVAESVLISKITLAQYGKNVPDYDTYLKNNSDAGKSKNSYTIEAESAFEKSDSTLGATIDNTDAAMTPQSTTNQVINSFGKNYWTENGQWASWVVPNEVKDGLYVLRFRAHQAGNVGIPIFRKLYINGEIPFKGAECVRFDYVDGWQIATFEGDEPYLVRMKAGDVITLEATTGPMAESLNKIYSSVNTLNDIYQSIIMVTGTSPDSERDYNIQKEIPTILDDFKNARDSIDSVGKEISAIIGEQNSKVFFISQFVDLLDSFVNNYRLIVPQLSSFKSHIDSFTGQTYTFNALGLELDQILLMNPESEIPKADVGFWEYLLFQIKRFFASFVADYSSQENSEKKADITVWTSLGRDQAQSMKQIISNDFTPKTGISVDFKISATSLSSAVLAGKEPDVSLTVAQDDIIDYAMRGQVMGLSDYIDNLPDDYKAEFADGI